MNPGETATPIESTAGVRADRRLGLVLAIVGAVLAFVLASTVPRDATVWHHLANGRSLAEGRSPPAGHAKLVSPDGDHRARVYALYDLPLYGAFRVFGGTGLVVLHAVLAAFLAVVVFLLARTELNATLAGLFSILSILSCHPWLGPTSVIFSCLFLAACVSLLRSESRLAETDSVARRPGWRLPLLVVVWANVDGWVVLGPVAISLFAVAQWRLGRGRVARAIGWVFVASLVASFISPNHAHTWDPASTVARVAAGVPNAPSPLHAWVQTVPLSAAVSSAVLALFGLVAITRDREGNARTWAPLWLVLVGLAVWRPAFTPFFAVIGGPVAAWGLAGFTRSSASAGETRWVFRIGQRVLAPVACVLLVVVAWSGWLAAPPYGRPSWSVVVDDGLREATEELGQWDREGVFGPDGRGLTFSSEVVAYRAWFGHNPGIASESRPVQAADLLTIREGLLGTDSAPGPAELRELLRSRKINHLILYTGESFPTERVVTRLAGTPDEWPLLYLRGRTAVFGWRDPAARGGEDRFAAVRPNVERRAFLPSPADQAPLDGPSRGPGHRHWSRVFVEPRLPESPDQGEASLYLAFFDGQRRIYEERNRAAWVVSHNTGLVGSLALPAPGPGPHVANLGLRAIGIPGDREAYAAGQDDGSYSLPLLAVRSARRAIHANPDDAKSYFLLGEAYLRLTQATRERVWRQQLPAFDRIRQVQAITAFQQALILRPDSPAAHGRLARLYRDRGSLDLALHHLGELTRIAQKQGPQPGESAKAAGEALAALERDKAELEGEVRRRVEIFEASKGNRRVLDLAQEAAGAGLPGRALEMLLKSDASEFGPEGAKLELDLLLWAGRVQDVRRLAEADLERNIGAVVYRETLACLAAATGHYREAGQEMRSVATALLRVPSRCPTPHSQASYDITRAILTAPAVGGNSGVWLHASLVRNGLIEEVRQISGSLRREANAVVVAGLLAMEAGQIDEAESLFRLALKTWQDRDGVSTGGTDFSGRPVAQDCLRLIAAPRTQR